MDIIELENWKRSKRDPGKREYAGQRTAQEVFAELQYRLESMGYLPDEYFMLDSDWTEGKVIPEGAKISCTTDYGESEGIYVDVYLNWYDEAQKKQITRSFITGKTLGETGADMDRMFLISSAITKAFYGDRPVPEQRMEETGGSIVHLSAEERRTLIDSLVAQRERLVQEMMDVEQFLRHVTGSITEYVNEVGQRPLHISDYDQAVLAVQDGDMEAFRVCMGKIPDQLGELLAETAGRPGVVGRKMTSLLLAEVKNIDCGLYRSACENAIDTGDSERTKQLMDRAAHCVENLDRSFYGEMILYAYRDHYSLAGEMIQSCTPEQIAAAPSGLLYTATIQGDHHSLSTLVENGINGNECIADIIQYCGSKRDMWSARNLLDYGLEVSPGNYSALHACVKFQQPEVGKMLLDRGMDFDKYQEWAEKHGSGGHEETRQALADYWQELKASQQMEAPEQGGMSYV